MSNHTPLQSFLQTMLSEKSSHSMGTAEITIVMDNASPAMYQRRRSTSNRFSLDVSDHSRGKSRWAAETGDQVQSCSPVQAPPHSCSPKLNLRKTPLIECDSSDEEDEDDGLIL
ncbi:unnamed protein product [Cylindrotheca closterium]|uniref:Uncharacterized protein n=1 Tax=Cylindrotheca closterium TaxID=2856 RepID=A0AAD2FMF1_9STRA|nr:unnamed protein product [Cylindrotheca closterium]CAJ1945578.1 unnamed protein product [Cylindrotheca closterium]CAJ1945579.1 unnamed protein product [Cylindrotheca closterium]CAJ1945580.1 unnamed protein product [Cylindrotheca closterium]